MATEVDLLATGMLSSLPAALLAGRDEELLEPLGMWRGGSPPKARTAIDRRGLAEGLARANAARHHPRAAELGEKLADPRTLVVVTGQQPGVLGGPLYTLTKAVTAVLLAEQLERDGHRAIAVFWVHTEDHDFAEVARAAVLAPSGPLELSLGDDPTPLVPVGERLLGEGIVEMFSAISAAVLGDRYQAWLDRVAGWYRPDATIGEAFGDLLVGLLGERCPLLLDAALPAVKAAQRPWLERLVDRRRELATALDERTRKVKDRGYRPQVRVQADAAPLFQIEGGERRRIIWKQNGYQLRGEPGGKLRPLEELQGLAREDPSRLSPSALARPAIQDAILGTTIQVLGPGELAYMVQAAGTHEVLGVDPPQVALRPQIVVLGAKQLGWLEASGVGLEEVLAADADLDRALARELGGDFVAPARSRIEGMLTDLEADAARLDSNLARPMEKTRQQILRALDTFAGKVAGSLANRDRVQRRRLEELRSACRPLGVLQERAISSLHFPGRFGDGFLRALWQLDLEPDRLQVIVPLPEAGSPAKGSPAEEAEGPQEAVKGDSP